ncbi:MAG: cytochrome [Nocardioides sp.]|nr:cytochrome [Nocardioides sp.]
MTATFDDADLSFDDDSDVVRAPTNDVAATREHDPINLSADAFWDEDATAWERSFAVLRRERPVSWQPRLETQVIPDEDDPGYFAVTRHADIVEVSQRNDVFVSGYGVMLDLLPPMFIEMGMSFLSMDDPRHDVLRKLVSAAFTPKQIKRIEDDIAARAKRIVTEAAGKPEIDFVHDIARHLPVEMFCDMFGIPPEHHDAIEHAADEITAFADPELLAGRDAADVQLMGSLAIHDIAEVLCAERRENPKNDLITSLVQATVDGEHLTDYEIGSFMTLLSVAATDTTRHTLTFGVKALTDFPEQRAWLWEDFEGRIGTSIEEFLRWGSVVLTFRRTCVEPYTLNGTEILPGDKVVMMYISGNRDEEVFTSPGTFDLQRSPNPHVVFGGGGSHFCLGNQLAKSMLRSLFREIHLQMPDIVAGEAKLLRTNFLRGALEMPFTTNVEEVHGDR